MKRIFLFVALISIMACSNEGPSEPAGGAQPGKVSAPVAGSAGAPKASPSSGYSIAIKPESVTQNTIIHLSNEGFKLSDAEIRWVVNDVPAHSGSNARFDPQGTRIGDRIWAVATITGEKIHSNEVQVVNTPPEIMSYSWTPEQFRHGDRLGIEVKVADKDEDDVTVSYEWSVNGKPAGKERELNAVLKRGDLVFVTIVPYDETDYGVPVTVKRQISNFPPVIIEHREATFEGQKYSYQVKASDPDSDQLTYSLMSAPEGMQIDPSKGLITWGVPADFEGTAQVSVSVDDGHNGIAEYTLVISVQ